MSLRIASVALSLVVLAACGAKAPAPSAEEGAAAIVGTPAPRVEVAAAPTPSGAPDVAPAAGHAGEAGAKTELACCSTPNPAGAVPAEVGGAVEIAAAAAVVGDAGATVASELAALPAGASALARKLAQECDEGKGRRCALLAQFYGAAACALPWEGAESGGEALRCDPAVAPDAVAARRLLERGCSGDAAAGCARLAPAGGGPLEGGLRGRLERACEAGRVDACRVLVATEGLPPKGQMPGGDRLVRYLNLACSAGSIDSCPAMLPHDATPAPAGSPSTVSALPADASPIVHESARLCDLDHAMMCSYVGMRWAFPGISDALPQDLARAQALFERACNARTTVGCVLLGDLRLGSEGVAPSEADLGAAIARYRQACEHHTLTGCARLAALFEKTRQPAALLEAAALALEACVGGEVSACEAAARLAVIR